MFPAPQQKNQNNGNGMSDDSSSNNSNNINNISTSKESEDSCNSIASSCSIATSSSRCSREKGISCSRNSVDSAHCEALDEYARKVQQWSRSIPIGLGLCPWALKSQRNNLLHYKTCPATEFSEVTLWIRHEAQSLCCEDASSSHQPLSTTLIVCPHVVAWNHDTTGFQVFEEFVKSQTLALATQEVPITLVSFHPNFLRWRGLPAGIQIGSAVQSYKAYGGFQKSQQLFPATVIETKNPPFGLRKIKVRFHDNVNNKEGRKDQYVPMDWLVTSSDTELGSPLPDNAMHRAPYPTVHLIRNEDLGRLTARDVSRVKRRNAHTMMKLGWEGVLAKVPV